ncbi:hypothetical protein DDE18_16250 [Nocardioides gansuensis]|uniref:histidine kinase n=1 Tax=Nocardioides gansuensis TaxID=2138300 RepID=A0A2T8F770_9ACTN|nr:histidine kinase dimerization/phospho-acceptor domain-containing protein [Nocardioides gansuensis]PVG81561.1 hypothetical protein DDE18_16250 [Nocardioides gansuensis]
MRQRLTLAFVGLALVILSSAGVVRAFTIADVTRDSELNHLGFDTRLIAHVVEDRQVEGPLTSGDVEPLVRDATRVTVEVPGAAPLVVEGAGFDDAALADPLRVRETVGETTVTAVRSGRIVSELVRQKIGSLTALILSLLALSGVVGFLLARALSRPFTQLANGAAALGRGRFDLDLPRSRIPEVAAVADALRAGAARLEESIRRDREALQHASHAIRTPLTTMRLELEQLTQRDDLDDDVRRTAGVCVEEILRVDGTVAELLGAARGRSLVAGAEVSLRDLGTSVAQRWSEELPDSRTVTAFVDSGADLTFTPGPVEQLLDTVLRDLAHRTTGPVTLRFAGHDEHLRITVTSGPSRPGDAVTDESVQTIAGVLGGRVRGDATDGSLEILLPRR